MKKSHSSRILYAILSIQFTFFGHFVSIFLTGIKIDAYYSKNNHYEF